VESPGRSLRIIARVLVGLGIVGLVVWFFASGTHRQVDEQLIRARIAELGPLGPLVFVLAFALLQPLGPSGHIFAVAASLVWSPIVAFGLALAGGVGSQVVGFLFYRHVAADWARSLIPERLLGHEERLVARPIRTVTVIRLFTFTWPVVSALLGVSRIRFAPMLIGTTIGLAPTVAFDVLFLTEVLRLIAR